MCRLTLAKWFWQCSIILSMQYCGGDVAKAIYNCITITVSLSVSVSLFPANNFTL